jgi:hypothetical protein
VEDAPAVAVAVAAEVEVEAAVAEVEVEAAVAVEDAPVLSKTASKPGGSNKRLHKSGATSCKKPRNEKVSPGEENEKESPAEAAEVTPLKGLFDGHLLAAKPTKR